MSEIEWTVISKSDGHSESHAICTENFSAKVTVYNENEYRVALKWYDQKWHSNVLWFKNINNAKRWAIANLTSYAQATVTRAYKSIAAAQEFLALVEGQTSTKHSVGNLPEFSDGVNE